MLGDTMLVIEKDREFSPVASLVPDLIVTNGPVAPT